MIPYQVILVKCDERHVNFTYVLTDKKTYPEQSRFKRKIYEERTSSFNPSIWTYTINFSELPH